MAGIDKKETDSLRRLAVPFNPISVTSCPSQSSHPASSSQSRTQASQPANPSQTAAWDFSLASSSGSSTTTWNHVPSLPASSSSSSSSSSWPSSPSGRDFGGSRLQGRSFWSGQRSRSEVDVTPRFSGMSLGDVMRVTVMQEMDRLNMNRQGPVDLSKSKT